MEPDLDLIRQAASVIISGGVVAYPTETFYGLGASALDRKALAKIFEIKHRPAAKPLIVLVASTEHLKDLVACIPPGAVSLMKHLWPGPATLLFPARPGLPVELCGNTGRIGIRISSHPWAGLLVREAGFPITATSANMSGHPSPDTAEKVAAQLRSPAPDFILDGGSTPGGLPSTIVDLCTDPVSIVRPGAVSPEDIAALCGKGHA